MRWALPGLAAALLVAAATALLAGGAPAASPRLALKAEHVAALNATVLAAPDGRTLYRLAPETGDHLLCTSSACLGAWRPLTVRSRSTAVRLPHGIARHARLLRRGHAFQVMLGADPLYTFSGDAAAGQAGGEGIASFGGTWHTVTVRRDSAPAAPAAPAPTPYPY